MAAWNIAAACEARRLYGDQNDDLWKGPGTVVKGQQIPADEAERLALTDLAKRVRAFVSVMKPEHREAADALVKKLDEQTALVAAKKE